MKCLVKTCKNTSLLMTVELCYPCSQLVEQGQREWVGLTDDDISKAKTLLKDNDSEYAIFFIMTRLQEYNT